MAEKRAEWKKSQPTRPRGRLIFIDETWAKTNMTRLRGRAPIGQRLRAKIPHGHWKTTTLLAALCTGGIHCSTVVDGAINADVFEAFVKQVLLRQLRPGDVVILDNLSSHKRASIRQMIEAAGATLLFLPPYSPDLNPIEMIFSKIKATAAFDGLPDLRSIMERNAICAEQGDRIRRRQLFLSLRVYATYGLKML